MRTCIAITIIPRRAVASPRRAVVSLCTWPSYAAPCSKNEAITAIDAVHANVGFNWCFALEDSYSAVDALTCDHTYTKTNIHIAKNSVFCNPVVLFSSVLSVFSVVIIKQNKHHAMNRWHLRKLRKAVP